MMVWGGVWLLVEELGVGGDKIRYEFVKSAAVDHRWRLIGWRRL